MIDGRACPYRYLLLHELAVHHSENGRLDEAIQTAEQALKLVPEPHMTWALLSRLYGQKLPRYRGLTGALTYQYKRLFERGLEYKAAMSIKKARGYVSQATISPMIGPSFPARFCYGPHFYGVSGISFMDASE